MAGSHQAYFGLWGGGLQLFALIAESYGVDRPRTRIWGSLGQGSGGFQGVRGHLGFPSSFCFCLLLGGVCEWTPAVYFATAAPEGPC